MSNGEAPEPHRLELLEVARRIRAREVSPTEVTAALLQRIDSLDDRLKSYVLVTGDDAMQAAEQAEREIARGRYRGQMHGIPIAIKDLFRTAGAPTRCGMMLDLDTSALSDATAVARLKAAGAVVLGKLQMTEGAYSDSHPSATVPLNPWNPEYWTGISSSGPAVATAARLCFGALASDTGGSIRWPCSATGLSGIKPTWGRVSRHGVFALAPTMDHVGPIARSVADAAALLDAVAGPDPLDPTSFIASPGRQPDASAVGEMTVGVDRRWNYEDIDPDVQSAVGHAVATLRELGAHIVEVSAPPVDDAVTDWAPLCAVEAAVAHASRYPTRRREYGPVLRSVLDAGRTVSGTDLHRISLRRAELRGRFTGLFRRVDVLLTPVQPFGPLTVREMEAFGARPHLVHKLQRFTAPFNLTGHPSVTLPAGFAASGLPVGVQLVGGLFEERRLCTAGAAFQRVTDWHRREPAL